MAEQGGYRRPSNPAPVSGPGAMSQRTDGRQPVRYMSGGPYGEGQEMMDLQSSAPMAETPPVASRPRRAAAAPTMGEGMGLTSLFAPSQRPDEPVTAGAPFGPGPGPTMMPAANGKLASTLRKLVTSDESGSIARLLAMAERRGW